MTRTDKAMVVMASALPSLLFVIWMLPFLLPPAHATWRPEYAKNPQAVRDWFVAATPTKAAGARLGIATCCEQAERLMTRFVGAGTEWSYYPDPDCAHKGCKLLPIPNDVVHEEPIRALDPADNDLPEFKAMRREGVLFIWNGKPTCFWPPEGGI